MDRIPEQYRHFWQPFTTGNVLYHHTLAKNIVAIRKKGLEPRDPAPKHWSGLTAVFMADPTDELYEESLRHVLAHVQDKGEHLVRLHIRTDRQLYRSTDPERTFQVIALDPINPSDIIRIEPVESVH